MEERMINLFNKFDNWKLHRFGIKLRKLKPELLSSWYEEQEERIRKEYEEELERLQDELFNVRKDLKEITNSRDYYRGKYEGVVETQDKVREQLLTKVETTSTKTGQLKQEVKQLKEDKED